MQVYIYIFKYGRLIYYVYLHLCMGIQVLNSYIHCMRGEEHLLQRDGGKVFLENSYISNLLHKDGKMKEDEFQYTHEDTIRMRVDNYLDHDMVYSKPQSIYDNI